MATTTRQRPYVIKQRRPAPVRPAPSYGTGAAPGRVSQAPGQSVVDAGGLGFLPRRGVLGNLALALTTLEGVERMALLQPMQLLLLLADVVPEVSRALSNDLRLGCGPDAVTLTARRLTADGGNEEAPDGTAAVNDLFENLPREVGGLQGALAKNFQMALFTGLCAVEAVPGERNQGVAEVWPVDTLTLQFRREPTGALGLYQRQYAIGMAKTPAQAQAQQKSLAGFVPMPADRFFWANMDALPDDPYGRAAYSTVLNAVLALIGALRDMSTAFHRVGTGRYNVGFDVEAWGIEAKNVIGLRDPEAIRQFLQAKYAEATAAFDRLNGDDTFFHGAKDTINVVGGSEAVRGAPSIIAVHLRRLVMALKQNPALMGVVEGTTETWSADQFKIYAGGLEAARWVAILPLVDAANLHLRLLGMPYTVHADTAPVRATQRLADAQAEGVEIGNEAAKVRNNWQTNRTAAQHVTGGDVPSPQDMAEDVPPKPEQPAQVQIKEED